jgi:hypothetical protein
VDKLSEYHARPPGPPSSKIVDLKWWQGHSPSAVAIIVLIAIISVTPYLVGYLIEPRGLHYTGALINAEDIAQHEAFASEMSAHLRYQNLLTPEATPRGWFLSPLELFFGLVQRATGIPYMVLYFGLGVLCAPPLAFSLMHLARRAGLSFPGVAAVVALLAGSFAPFVIGAAKLGLIPTDTGMVPAVGGDATPTFAGTNTYLLIAILVLIAIPLEDSEDPGRGFRLAGVPLLVIASIYPFFVPTLLLTAVLCAALWARGRGWKSMLKGLGWLGICSGPPIMYWAVLPQIDGEYARFSAGNHVHLFSIPLTLVSLGLGAGAIVGIPRLLRGNAYQQMLGCFAAAFVLALYFPPHPWRSHLFMFSPVLVIAALAAWWPMFLRLRRWLRWTVIGSLLTAAMISTPYYFHAKIKDMVHFAPPTYMTTGDVAAIQWIADQPGTEVVLARPDLSPFVASRGHHRVLVGQRLWTHQYERRRAEVEAVFENGADPRSLLTTEQVAWVLIDGDRGVPAWAMGVKPDVRFDQTVVLRADRLLEHLEGATAPGLTYDGR